MMDECLFHNKWNDLKEMEAISYQ